MFQYYRHTISAWRTVLEPLVDELKPDLLHANNSLMTNYAVGLVGRKKNVRTISHQKGFEYVGSLSRTLTKHSPFDHHIATSGAIALHLHSLGLNPQCCTTVYEPVNSPPEDLVARHNNDLPVVAMHSMVLPAKGQHVFVHAVAQLINRTDVPFRVEIAGTTPSDNKSYLDTLAEMVDNLGIKDRVCFVGHQRDVYQYLSKLDIAVHAAVEPEPFGRVAAEAMLCGLPTIVTADGGPAEYITDGVTGLCVPRNDIHTLTLAMEQLVNLPERRRELGNAAREFGLVEFDAGNLTKQVVEIYDRVLRPDYRSTILPKLNTSDPTVAAPPTPMHRTS